MEITIATMGRLMKKTAMDARYFGGMGAEGVLASTFTR
jgi:hypothetical protein